jgi:L-lactate dehydrogenase complex protein LldF
MSNSERGADFFESSRRGASDQGLRQKLENSSGRHLEHLAHAIEEFPAYNDERDRARKIKQDAIGRLDELLLELKRKLEARNCTVFFAADADEASKYIVELARTKGVKLAVKGKSMTTEEIELNPALKQAGVEVVESDLGEYIVQLRRERPSHIITPAIHLSKEDVGELFKEKLGVAYTAEPEALTAVARDRLRQTFLSADMGIVGVNFAIAETGTLVLVENEGNQRMSIALPETLVAIMGIEKVIARLEDLSHFLEILARTGTGQNLTTYTNFINGPRRPGELDGPGEMHVVILDNGRSRMLADPVLREALCCIRCGACLNVCPVYRRIGGHAYNSVYPGPIGSVVSPPIFGSNSARQLPFASTLCGACKDVCPVKIDLPKILLHLRWKASQAENPVQWPRAARRARSGAAAFARMAQHPRLMRLSALIAHLMLRPFASNGFIKWLPPPFNAWTKTRDFPLPRRKPTPIASKEVALR